MAGTETNVNTSDKKPDETKAQQNTALDREGTTHDRDQVKDQHQEIDQDHTQDQLEMETIEGTTVENTNSDSVKAESTDSVPTDAIRMDSAPTDAIRMDSVPTDAIRTPPSDFYRIGCHPLGAI